MKVEEVGVILRTRRWLSSSGAEFPLSFALLYRAEGGPRNQVLVILYAQLFGGQAVLDVLQTEEFPNPLLE